MYTISAEKDREEVLQEILKVVKDGNWVKS
jgi:hypothetical protein